MPLIRARKCGLFDLGQSSGSPSANVKFLREKYSYRLKHDVRFGSKADMAILQGNVCFTPESGY